MKLKPILLCLILLVPVAAFGDQKTELAKEFMELTHVSQMMDEVKAQVMMFQDQIVTQMNIPEDKKKETSSFQKELKQKVNEIMDFEQMRNDHIELFANAYTLEELKEMVRFFKSPVGQSMLEKQTGVIQKALEMSQEKVGILVPELQRMTEEFEQSLKTK